MKDLNYILDNWNENDPDIRKFYGEDGIEKLQVRFQLNQSNIYGISQMNLEGRPDGKRPYGFDSLFQYYEHDFINYCHTRGTEEDYKIDQNDATLLLEEVQDYIQRCSFLVVQKPISSQDRRRIIRDGEFEFQTLDFIEKYAKDYGIIQYAISLKPEIVMFTSRMMIVEGMRVKDYEMAFNGLKKGKKRILKLQNILEGKVQDYLTKCINDLNKLEKYVKRVKPITRVEQLENMLEKANIVENYEAADAIKKEIRGLNKNE
jgi:hypothetical protein